MFDDLVEIKKINIVGYWNWDIHNDTCPICRNNIYECIDCENKTNETIDSVIGVCGHAYHFDCISTWLKTRQVCPLCNAKWEYLKTKK